MTLPTVGVLTKVKGRTPEIVAHDTGIMLRRGPIIVHLIRDANDPKMFLDIHGEWTDQPHMCDAHNPEGAAREHIERFGDVVGIIQQEWADEKATVVGGLYGTCDQGNCDNPANVMEGGLATCNTCLEKIRTKQGVYVVPDTPELREAIKQEVLNVRNQMVAMPREWADENATDEHHLIHQLRTKLNEAEARLKRIAEAATADAEDMAKMRDGTKLTRHGLVETIAYWHEEAEKLRGEVNRLNNHITVLDRHIEDMRRMIK